MHERDLLMIPGPVEFHPEVLRELGRKTRSHMDPDFVSRFGMALKRLREVAGAPSAQPFVVSGSGTLAMEMAVANLVEPEDRALVVNTGYFSDRMALMLERHGARVSHLKAPLGRAPGAKELEEALERVRPKVVTLTHVDTSTGVCVDAQALLAVIRRTDALSVVDGVCSEGAEPFEQEAWGADIFLTASQKAMGTPPGLALLTVSPRALDAWRGRKQPPATVYGDFAEWLPIMQAYEEGKPAYFATPPVNLICALNTSLALILEEGRRARFDRHQKVAEAFRAAWEALGLRSVAEPGYQARSLSALYYPEGVDAQLLSRIRDEGVVVAGGLHPEIKSRYFRVGHMNTCSAPDVLATVSAIEKGLRASGMQVEPGKAIAAASVRL